MQLIINEYIKPKAIDLAKQLSNEWNDEVAEQLHKTLSHYLEYTTRPDSDLSREPAEPPKPEPVRIPIPPNTVCFPVIEEKRKKRNTPDKYQDRKVVNARYQRLFELMTSEGNLGKEVQVKPEDIGPDCTMEELHMLCKRFNNTTWRMKNASGTKLMYRKQLFNFACKFVRADQDLRALRWGNRN